MIGHTFAFSRAFHELKLVTQWPIEAGKITPFVSLVHPLRMDAPVVAFQASVSIGVASTADFAVFTAEPGISYRLFGFTVGRSSGDNTFTDILMYDRTGTDPTHIKPPFAAAASHFVNPIDLPNAPTLGEGMSIRVTMAGAGIAATVLFCRLWGERWRDLQDETIMQR